MVVQTFVRRLTQTGNSDYIAGVIRLRQGKCFVKIIQIQIHGNVDILATSTDQHMWQISKKAKTAYDGSLVDPDIVWAKSFEDPGAAAVHDAVRYPLTFRPMIPRFQTEGDIHILYDDAQDVANNVATFKIIADVTPARY